MNTQFNINLTENFLPYLKENKKGKKFFIGKILNETYIVYIQDYQLSWFEEKFQDAAEWGEREVSVEISSPFDLFKSKDGLMIINYFTDIEVNQKIWDESEFDNFVEAAEIAADNSKQSQNKTHNKSLVMKILDFVLG